MRKARGGGRGPFAVAENLQTVPFHVYDISVEPYLAVPLTTSFEVRKSVK